MNGKGNVVFHRNASYSTHVHRSLFDTSFGSRHIEFLSREVKRSHVPQRPGPSLNIQHFPALRRIWTPLQLNIPPFFRHLFIALLPFILACDHASAFVKLWILSGPDYVATLLHYLVGMGFQSERRRFGRAPGACTGPTQAVYLDRISPQAGVPGCKSAPHQVVSSASVRTSPTSFHCRSPYQSTPKVCVKTLLSHLFYRALYVSLQILDGAQITSIFGWFVTGLEW